MHKIYTWRWTGTQPIKRQIISTRLAVRERRQFHIANPIGQQLITQRTLTIGLTLDATLRLFVYMYLSHLIQSTPHLWIGTIPIPLLRLFWNKNDQKQFWVLTLWHVFVLHQLPIFLLDKEIRPESIKATDAVKEKKRAIHTKKFLPEVVLVADSDAREVDHGDVFNLYIDVGFVLEIHCDPVPHLRHEQDDGDSHHEEPQQSARKQSDSWNMSVPNWKWNGCQREWQPVCRKRTYLRKRNGLSSKMYLTPWNVVVWVNSSQDGTSSGAFFSASASSWGFSVGPVWLLLMSSSFVLLFVWKNHLNPWVTCLSWSRPLSFNSFPLYPDKGPKYSGSVLSTTPNLSQDMTGPFWWNQSSGTCIHTQIVFMWCAHAPQKEKEASENHNWWNLPCLASTVYICANKKANFRERCLTTVWKVFLDVGQNVFQIFSLIAATLIEQGCLSITPAHLVVALVGLALLYGWTIGAIVSYVRLQSRKNFVTGLVQWLPGHALVAT